MDGLHGLTGLGGTGVDEEDVVLGALFPQRHELFGGDGLHTAGQHVVGHVGHHVDHVHGGGERRRVGDLQVGDVFHGGLAVLQHGGHGVDAGLEGVTGGAGALDAQHAAVALVHHQFQAHHVLFGIEVGAVQLFHGHGDGVIAFLAGAFHSEAGAAEGHVEQFHGPGAHEAGEAGIAAGQVGADDAALAVGHAAQGQVAQLAGDEVLDGHAVAAGIDVGVAGLHLFIDHDGAEGGHFQTGVLGQLAVGQETGGKDHQLGGQFALVGDDLAHGAVLAFQLDDLFRGVDGQAVGLAVVGGHLAHVVGEHAGQHLVHHFHHADLDAPHVGQGHGSFQTDETAAHDDGLVDLAVFAGFADDVGGFQTGEGQDVLEVMAFHRRHARGGAGGQHQLVVGQLFFLAGDHVAHQQGLGGAVDGHGAGLVAHGDAFHGTEEFGVTHGVVGCGAQVVEVVDLAGHIIGDAAAAVGDEEVFIHQGDLGVGHQALAAAGSLGTQGNAADNQDFLCHDRLSL